MSKFSKLVLTLLMMFSLVGCSVPKLSEQYNEEDVLNNALAIIEVVNERDYETLVDLIRDDLVSEDLKENLEVELDKIISEAGAYQEYKRYQTTSTKDDSGYEFAVIAIECIYENSELTYTISFDEEYELVGIFVR